MRAIFSQLLSCMDSGTDTVLATIIAESGSAPRGEGAQMLCGETGLLSGTVGGGAVEQQSLALAQEVLKTRQNTVRTFELRREGNTGMACGGAVTVLFHHIPARDAHWRTLAGAVLQHIADREAAVLLLPLANGVPRLARPHTTEDGFYALPLTLGERALLFGAGHCSAALSPLLQTVGFRVTVMDNRAALADPARFPGAEQVICGDFERLSDYVQITEDDFVVVMTSGHNYDFIVEAQVLRHPCAYVGVIGSKSKKATVNAMLRDAGLPDAAIDTVHTPIGTAIGAVTPQEIAVSIAGEMIQCRAALRAQSGVTAHPCPMR